MQSDDSLGIWSFPAGSDYQFMAGVALARLEEPAARGMLIASRGDVITLQVVEGELSGGSDSKLYVEKRGGYELLRRESGQARAPGEQPPVTLTLLAWPLRG